MKFFRKCPICKKRSLYIAKRKLKLPVVNIPVTSEKEMCNKCYKLIKQVK